MLLSSRSITLQMVDGEDQPMDHGQPNNRKNIPGKRHGARNQHRHVHFAKWLQKRFPESFQQSKHDDTTNNTMVSLSNNNNNVNHNDTSSIDGMHILDVAGGKGELTARLSMCLQQKVVMVDPRPANVVDCFETLVLPKIPNKWQQRIQQQLAINPDFVKETLSQRVRQLVTTFDENSLHQDDQLQQAVVHASLLIGLHADGATEAIVDAALQHQKPFVVVPCCVFPNFFPHRHVVMEHGQSSVPVRTHSQFCHFLLHKHAGFRMDILPFDGRNVAIWWDGKTNEPPDDADLPKKKNNDCHTE